MDHYDPDTAPDPSTWQELAEQQRRDLVEQYHRDAQPDMPQIEMHALVHVLVENRITDGDEPTVDALQRMIDEGLSRHDALHAVGTVLLDQLEEALEQKPSSQGLADRLRALTAEDWRKRFEGQ